MVETTEQSANTADVQEDTPLTPEQEKEIVDYIQQLLESICVDDQKIADENLETLTDTIYEQMKHHKDNPSKEDIRKMLANIQKIVNDKELNQEQKQKKL